jgi:hypothetical protein
LAPVYDSAWKTASEWITYVLAVAGVLLAGSWATRRAKAAADKKLLTG